MIPSIIFDSLLLIAIVLAVLWACHRIYRGIVDEPEPETYGDDGGRPTAPDTGSSLLEKDNPQ